MLPALIRRRIRWLFWPIETALEELLFGTIKLYKQSYDKEGESKPGLRLGHVYTLLGTVLSMLAASMVAEMLPWIRTYYVVFFVLVWGAGLFLLHYKIADRIGVMFGLSDIMIAAILSGIFPGLVLTGIAQLITGLVLVVIMALKEIFIDISSYPDKL